MNAKYAGVLWPFALVLLTGIYGYWAVQRELVSSRPPVTGEYDVPDPVPPIGIHTLHSRLWQDPLSTAYYHWTTLPEKERANNLTAVSDSDDLTKAVREAATSSRESNRTQAVLKTLWSHVVDRDSPTATTEEALFTRRTVGMRKFFQSLVDKVGQRTLCMPVLLPGGPYAEDKEKRMRTRYAVVTALAESGYSLKYSTRMSYVVVRIHIRVLRGWQEREVIVPVKLYRHDDRPQVLVLWINESELELRPLLAIHRILNSMFYDVTKPQNLDVSIIGPSTSRTLKHMGDEIGHINDAFFPKVVHEANTHKYKTDKETPTHHANKSDFANIKAATRLIAKKMRDEPDVLLDVNSINTEVDIFLQQILVISANIDKIGDELEKAPKNTESANDSTQHIENGPPDWNTITRAANQIELAEATVIIRRQLDNINQAAHSVIQRLRLVGAARANKKDIDGNFAAALTIIGGVGITIKAAEQLSEECLASNGPNAERIRLASEEIARGVENIKGVATKTALDGASAEIRAAADVLTTLANSVLRIAENIRAVERTHPRRQIARQNDKSEPVTVIQRAVAIIKQQAETAKDGKPDVEKVTQHLNRIKVAQAYELTKQAADRIRQNVKTISAKADEIDDAVQTIAGNSSTIIDRAFEKIKQLAFTIDMNDKSDHWYATATSENNAERIQGCMPLLSSLEYGGNAVKLFSTRATMDKINFSTNNFVDLRRVIGTDRQLAVALRKELRCRGAAPGRIVLITEHDTAYGRAFPETFQNVFTSSRIVSFKILRGIDGSLPGDAPTRSKASSKKSSSTDLPEIVERPPEGRSQYDYLKRLRHRIEQLDDITAIGVVGNDVYDKLLVLRALKPHFPDCVFFTTDLNAIYSHPDERQHTRNLLIASHFDLRLNDWLQKSTAPFRDSYQTSTFLATRLALHHDDPDYWFFDKENVGDKPTSEDSLANWAAVVDHWFGDGENKGNSGNKEIQDRFAFAPTLHVVGSSSTRSLTPFDEDTIEGKIHPRRSNVAGTWHYFFVGGFTLTVIGLAWLLTNRDRLRESQLLADEGNTPWIRAIVKRLQRQVERAQRRLASTGRRQGLVLSLDRRLESFGQLLARRGKTLESKVNLGLLVMSGIGCVLVLVLCLRGYMGDERSDFIGGYSTWPRKLLYGFTGIFAVLSVAHVLDHFQIHLKHVQTKCPTVGRLAASCFEKVHIVKIVLLAIIIAYTGGAFVYELGFVGFWIPAFAVLVGLGTAWRHYARSPLPRNEQSSPRRGTTDVSVIPPSGNLIIGVDLAPAIGYGLISVVSITALAILGELLMEESHLGWHPRTISRGWLSQFGDWFATAYAFGAVVLLLSTLIYFHLWCREFARFARHVAEQKNHTGSDSQENEDDSQGLRTMSREFGETDEDKSEEEKAREENKENDGRLEYERLWVIGRLSSVIAGHAPLVMGLIFVLVIAYHPSISPMPMPLGLVVMITVLILVFIASAVSLRWHFDEDRKKTISELQRKLDEISKDNETQPAPPPEAVPSHQLILTMSEEGRVRERERDVSRQQIQQQEQEKQLQKTQTSLMTNKEKIKALSEGVFRSWNESPIGWICGGGTALALADLWVRWWTIGL